MFLLHVQHSSLPHTVEGLNVNHETMESHDRVDGNHRETGPHATELTSYFQSYVSIVIGY